jgi:hypothetical protein|tara:strand:- start:790 stop:1068 length:279 start_codon:yes stop_codon:yes gene_type:complete
MFALDRETAILVGVVVCIAASVYMYRELKNSKEDITKIKTFLDNVQQEDEDEMYRQAQAPEMAQVSAESKPEVVNEPRPVPEIVFPAKKSSE